MLRFASRFCLFALCLLLTFPAAAEEESIVVGAACPSLGVSRMATDQQSLVACLKDTNGNLIWKSMTGGGEGTPTGTLAYFALAGCPSGWAMANGANGTLDVRGEFLRAWDGGRGIDPGRTLGSVQGDAIRNIVGTIGHFHGIGWWSSNALFSSYQDSAEGHNSQSWKVPGRAITFDASRVVPTASENRPRNIALIVCQKI